MFGRTNKRNAARDISKLEGRSRTLALIEARIHGMASVSGNVSSEPRTPPNCHYRMPRSEKDWSNLGHWLRVNGKDRAFQVSMSFLYIPSFHYFYYSRPSGSIFVPISLAAFSIGTSTKVLRRQKWPVYESDTTRFIGTR